MCRQKIALFGKLWSEHRLVWLDNVCNVRWGYILSLCEGRKNKINSPQTAPPYQRSTTPVRPFLLLFQFSFIVSMCRVGGFSTLAYNGRHIGEVAAASHFLRARNLQVSTSLSAGLLPPFSQYACCRQFLLCQFLQSIITVPASQIYTLFTLMSFL